MSKLNNNISNQSLSKPTQMEIKQKVLMVLKLAQFFMSLALFFLFWLLFRYHTLAVLGEPDFRYNVFAVIGYGMVLFFLNRTYSSFLVGYRSVRAIVFSQALSQFISLSIVYAVVSVAWKKFNNPLVFLGLLAIQFLFDTVWAFTCNTLYPKFIPPKRTILIYRNDIDKKRFGATHGKQLERLYRVEKELQYRGNSFKDIRDELKDYEAIFVAGVPSNCRNGIAKYCKETSVPGFFLPHIGDVIMQESRHLHSFDSPVMFISRTVPKPEYALLKRAFDIFASALALLILSPVMLITALAIHFYDGGSPIYKQKRLTKNGRVFEMYKFRSMREDAEKDGVARFSTGDNDDRITPIGRIIRKIRLDELPQLWNILRGDMSIVGPRPERPEIADQFYEYLPAFQLRLQVKAGLTGYAQVYGRYNSDPYEKLEFDLMYINNMNVITDLMLMFATIAILFSADSTQGFADAHENLTSEEILDYEALQEEDF